MEKVLNCKLLLAIVGAVLAALSMWQEKTLGSGNAWLLSVIIPIIGGLLCEVFNMVINQGKYNWLNVVSWIVGGIAGVLVMLII
jgi:hypothetical protein